MKRVLLLFLISFCFLKITAQLDREHWFAPVFDGNGNLSQVQRIYLSTNDTTPFQVRVYSGNILRQTLTVSKGNPVYWDVPRSLIFATEGDNDHFRVSTKGLYLNGDKPFFATLRFSVSQHGEILTSKGTAGIGTEFRAVVPPITVYANVLNFTTGILATEDNTQVTVSGYRSNIVFGDGQSRNQITFTLNKGQSYIIDGNSDYNQNWTGFIGAKITANKNISITNGSFTGQYAGSYGNSSDILMDQGVPVDKLGTEFVLMKGNGTLNSNMEKGMVVAVVDNTQVYLNNATTPAATLSAGQHFLTPNDAYLNQGSQHYNMRIRTSENAYVYQLLAGDDGSSMVATGGFNYIPPLSCYLPKKIDEIGLIDQNRVYLVNLGNYLNSIPTKLNIITEAGATVSVTRNGAPLPLNASNGPFNVSGNANWKTYSINNVTGNIAVFSTSAVTAGISAGNDAVGYGGYFAGFSFIPAVIKREGECLPGVKLEVTEGFDTYLWLIKVNGLYEPAPGVNNLNTYDPSEAGIYAVKIKQGSCPEVQTQDFKFYNCTTYTNYDFETCTTVDITPQFALSTQQVNPGTVVVDIPPTKGTVTKNAAGILTYTANLNATGTDTFKFSFCGDGSIPDCETVQSTIELNQIERYDVEMKECSNTTTSTFNLLNAAVTPNTAVTKKFYRDVALTQEIPAADLQNFTSGNTVVYVKMDNTFGCTATAKITLKVLPNPVVNPALYAQTICDEAVDGILDGIYRIDPTTITSYVLQNPSAFTVKYYDTETKALAGDMDNITGIFTFTANTSIWIRVQSAEGCLTVKPVPLTIGAKLPLITTTAEKGVCDDDLNNSETINLGNYINLFNADSGVTAQYFSSLVNAQNNVSPLNASQIVTGNASFFYRLKKAGACDNIGTLNIIFNKPTPSTVLQSNYPVCEGTIILVDAGTGFSAYHWSTGTTGQTANYGIGSHWVELTNALGCVYRQYFTITETPKPVFNIAALNTLRCDENFDGMIPVIFSTEVTPVILPNASQFTVRYYTSEAFAQAGGTNNLPNNWSYSGTTTIWVRADSPNCASVIDSITFGLASSVPLLRNTITKTVCDTDLNGSQAVNLATYLPEYVNSTTGLTIRYFESLANAQNNTANIPQNQTITADKTFYIRFSSGTACPSIAELKLQLKAPTPSTTLAASYSVCQGDAITLDAGPGYSSYLWSTGATTRTISATAGNYWVEITNGSLCHYRQNVTVVNAPRAVINTANFNGLRCDEDFDGSIPVIFSTEITPSIVQNAQNFTVRYYATQAQADAGGNNNLPDNWSYTTATQIWVRVDAPSCPYIKAPLNFGFGTGVSLIDDDISVSECDDNQDGSMTINLSTYNQLISTETGVTFTYFETLANAQANVASIPSSQTFSGIKSFYVRLTKSGKCPEIAKLTVRIKIPRLSTTLDNLEVCPGELLQVDAGNGFSNYLWSNGDTTPTTQLPGGTHWVDLSFDGCTVRQEFTISEVDLPQIVSLIIEGQTVTVNVTGGNPPYQYSINNINFQSSNVFHNVPSGPNTVYVTSADQCDPVTLDFRIVKILNVITPNGDGYNDTLNYEDLNYMAEAKIQVYDRMGNLIYKGSTTDRYIWDGKVQGRPVNTGTYWYVLEYRDPSAVNVTQVKGWVLVKNRNF